MCLVCRVFVVPGNVPGVPSLLGVPGVLAVPGVPERSISLACLNIWKLKISMRVSPRHILLVMSFAALLRGPSAAGVPKQRTQRRQHKYDRHTVEASIELGERAATFLQSIYGQERATQMLEKVAQRANGSQPSPAADPMIVDLDGAEDPNCNLAHLDARLPHGFWRRFMTEEMAAQYTDRKKMQLIRALKFYVQRKREGASTPAAMRGMRARNSCRSSGGALNSRKAAGLGFALLQFFVDHVQRMMTRADSCLLMSKAREMRAALVAEKWPEKDLPMLEGAAGHQWFRRWRQRYGIVKKVTGMKLKVPWRKVKRRTGVFLGNIFRLRAFWEICHPDTPMRFLSVDQKPSWFNNAGHTGTFAQKGGSQPSVREIFAHTRQRYSILTSVPSWAHTDQDMPPKIALLFKAMPNGTVINQLRASKRSKSWMKVQVQEHGSYRSADVVEALDWMLPNASNSTESIIVLLDWYSGHLTEEVAEVVRRKGHVLIFHGGGCTPFTQINDTHLHAQLAKLLIQVENAWAIEERRRLLSMGQNKTPTMTRDEILSIVQTSWLSIDHARVAEKGYKQTGPTMPLRGPVASADVFPDLLRVMGELDGSSTPTEVGTTLRDKAVAFVREGFDSGKWTTWADCHKLIEEHDCLEEALHEGLEAFGADPDDTDEDEDEDKHEDGAGGDGDGLPAQAIDAEDLPAEDPPLPPPAKDPPLDGDDDDGDDGPGGGSGCSFHLDVSEEADCASVDGENSEAADSNLSIEIAAARRLLYDEAMKKRDDTLLRCIRKQMRDETLNQKDASTDVGMLLRKRAQDQQAEDAKRRREAVEEDRLAAKDLEETKLIRAKAEQAAAEARLACLRQIIVNRRDAEARKQTDVLQRAQERWLQTQYPALLARRCIDTLRGLSRNARGGFEREVGRQLELRTFERQLFIKDLWVSDKSLTLEWSMVQPLSGGPRRQVRCGVPFQELIDKEAPQHILGRDPVDQLDRLFSACVPRARRVFAGNYQALRLLHVNDYVLEKAFVYGIVALSKWLGEERFPYGVYGQWPPKFPAALVPRSQGSPQVDLDDDHFPLHLDQGRPAASSSAAS